MPEKRFTTETQRHREDQYREENWSEEVSSVFSRLLSSLCLCVSVVKSLLFSLQSPLTQREASAMPLRTPLYDRHQAKGGTLVDFAGWMLPVRYTTITD